MTIASLSAAAGGPSRTASILCTALAEAGVRVTLVALCGRDEARLQIVRPDESVAIRIVPAWSMRGGRVNWSPQFRSELSKSIDCATDSIIHDNGLWLPCNHTAASVARRRSVALISSPRGMLEPWALSHKSCKKRLAWWLYQRRDIKSATVLHATSHTEARSLRLLGLRQPIAMIPNGVTLPRTTQDDQLETQSRLRKVVFLGRIYPVKGLLNLVKAWSELRPRDWRCLIVGPNETGHQAAVETAICEYRLEDQFAFPGMLNDEDKWKLLEGADLLVLPSFSENFGLAVAEALAAGVPVITTKGTPWEELVAHRCGWWVSIGVDPLAAALREAMALSDEDRREMGQRGRRLVEEKYSWPRIAREMISVYQWILGHGPIPGCVTLK